MTTLTDLRHFFEKGSRKWNKISDDDPDDEAKAELAWCFDTALERLDLLEEDYKDLRKYV